MFIIERFLKLRSVIWNLERILELKCDPDGFLLLSYIVILEVQNKIQLSRKLEINHLCIQLKKKKAFLCLGLVHFVVVRNYS